jgi:iron complex outermembrane receptor protein
MVSKTLLLAIGILLPFGGDASALTGAVTNPEGEPLASVSVVTNVGGLGTISDEDGAYILRDDERINRISFSCVGYEARQFQIDELPAMVILQRIYIRGSDIVVRAGRAQAGLSPVAFDNLSEAQIERDYTMGDLPVFIDATTNLYSYTYSGGSLGFTEYSIRGFDAKHIAVYIDGVPLNDPEDHTTYFVDLPDFAANIEDIQVQRGVGASMYGDATFGGAINIASAGMNLERRVSLTAGYGQYLSDGERVGDMRKQAVEYNSGLIDGRWTLSGRYSKQYSDGYRERAWWDGWSYYLSASRLDPNMTTTLNVYGGPVKYHMAWYGLTRTGLENNPRYNPLEYANQTDNFNQPHYELHNSYRASENLTINNTLYYIRGRGFYEQYKDGEGDLGEYNLTVDDIADSTGYGSGELEIDLVRQKLVTKHQVGWAPRLEFTRDNGRTTLGGSMYYFESTHWGQIVWAENVRNTIDPQHKYYEYYGRKYHVSLFADERRSLSDRWLLTVSTQLKYLHYSLEQLAIGAFTDPAQFDLNWLFFAPRAGLTYHADEHTDLFASLAMASREPADGMIFDADDHTAQPAVHDDELLVDPERVYDFELGYNRNFSRGSIRANLYWMDFRNEIVESGALDEDGSPILGNAERSVHSGIELAGSYRFSDQIEFSGNFAISRNKLEEHVTYLDLDYDGVGETPFDLSGNTIAGFPGYLGNLIWDGDFSPLRAVLHVRLVGRQYVDNTGDEESSIDPFTLTSLALSTSIGDIGGLGHVTALARINNLFNTKYEAAGYNWGPGYDWGIPEYIPGAERNFYLQLRWEFE